MDIDPTVKFSLSANFDRTYPRGVHVAANSYVAFGAVVLCHDRTRGLYLDTVIEENCFIGARSMILPGVRVGRESIVAAGAVVTKDVPARSVVAGNPAVIIRSNVEVGRYGRFRAADQPGGTRGKAPREVEDLIASHE
jgi:acetyltransferase-like isoleucine patch superfamily enzyme